MTTVSNTICKANDYKSGQFGSCGNDSDVLRTPYAWKVPRSPQKVCTNNQIDAFYQSAFVSGSPVADDECSTCLDSEWKGTTPDSEFDSYGPSVKTPNGHRVVNTGGCRAQQAPTDAMNAWKGRLGEYEWLVEQCATEVCDHLTSENAFQACRLQTLRGAFTPSGSGIVCQIVGMDSTQAGIRFTEMYPTAPYCGKSAGEEADNLTTVRDRFVTTARAMCGL